MRKKLIELILAFVEDGKPVVWLADEILELFSPNGENVPGSENHQEYVQGRGVGVKADEWPMEFTDEQIETATQGLKFSNHLNNEATMEKRGIVGRRIEGIEVIDEKDNVDWAGLDPKKWGDVKDSPFK